MAPDFGATFLGAVGEARAQLPTIVGTLTLSLNKVQVEHLKRDFPDEESTGWWLREPDECSRRSVRQRTSVSALV